MSPRVLLLLLLFASAAIAQEGDAIVDENYRFRLEKPEPRWRLLGPEEVQRLAPDAVAGLVGPDGVYGVIIVEEAPGVDKQALARLILDGMPLENKREITFGEVEFLGRPAIRFEVEGLIQGFHARYQGTVFLHEGHAYQLISWCAAVRDGSAGFRAVREAFSLLPGEVRGRTESVAVRDCHGVGWRVRDGAFASAVLRIAVRPTGNWRVAIGSELDLMDPDAEVGLIHSSPEVYATVVAEWFRGADRERLLEELIQGTAEEFGLEEVGEPKAIRVSGIDSRLHRFRSTGEPSIDFHKCVVFSGDLCVQVVAWHMSGIEEQAVAVLPEAFDAIRILDEERSGALARELAKLPDTQNAVGPQFALRKGLYRDFAYGVTWKAPPGFWRILSGQQAREANPDFSLVVQEPALGVTGLLILEPKGEFDAATYRTTILANMAGEDHAVLAREPEIVRLGEARLLIDAFHDDVDGAPWAYRVATAVEGPTALQLIFHGPEANVMAAEERIREALVGLRFVPDLAAEEDLETDEGGRRFLDHRLGYVLELPGRGWLVSDFTPRALLAGASMRQFRRGERAFFVLAMCVLQEGQDETWFEQFLLEVLRARVGERIATEPERSEATLAGVPCRRLFWKPEGDRPGAEVHTLRRDRSFYAILTSGRAPPEGPTNAELLAGFRLLD